MTANNYIYRDLIVSELECYDRKIRLTGNIRLSVFEVDLLCLEILEHTTMRTSVHVAEFINNNSPKLRKSEVVELLRLLKRLSIVPSNIEFNSHTWQEVLKTLPTLINDDYEKNSAELRILTYVLIDHTYR